MKLFNRLLKCIFTFNTDGSNDVFVIWMKFGRRKEEKHLFHFLISKCIAY